MALFRVKYNHFNGRYSKTNSPSISTRVKHHYVPWRNCNVLPNREGLHRKGRTRYPLATRVPRPDRPNPIPPTHSPLHPKRYSPLSLCPHPCESNCHIHAISVMRTTQQDQFPPAARANHQGRNLPFLGSWRAPSPR